MLTYQSKVSFLYNEHLLCSLCKFASFPVVKQRLVCVHVCFLLVGKSFSGREFDAMSTEEQSEACKSAKLFSRVEPAHKSKIVDYLQKGGAVAAMVR